MNELPIPAVMEPKFPHKHHSHKHKKIPKEFYEVSITQFKQELGLYDESGKPLETTVWGYNGQYPGPTIEATKGIPVFVKWENKLVDNHGRPLQHHLKIDRSIHWANPHKGVPLVTHLHGGHIEWESDGVPDAWYTPYFKEKGKLWRKKTYRYDNEQEATTLWYHDHAVGITRLNVYMGLAGFYLLRDDHEKELNLPSGEYEVPLVIQDRSFYENGELYYPCDLSDLEDPLEKPLPSDVTVLPEMYGDFILVNGKVWPFLEVEPRNYRLRLLNGSDSRFYDLDLPGVKIYQIGTDGGLLNAPVKRKKLLLGPAERVDLIVDFSGPELWGKTLVLKNSARSPYPFGDPADPNTTGQVMAFKVTKPLNPEVADYAIPKKLRTPIATLKLDHRRHRRHKKNKKDTRQLVLFEGTDEYGRLNPLLGTAEDGPLKWTDPITENPMLNDVEDWEIINTTGDAHPVHLHLVHFQVVNTQKFDVDEFVPGDPSSIQYIGPPQPPSKENAGWKDTYIVNPGEVARVRAKFEREGFFVWHCHILSHEDFDMMRPFYVGEMPRFFREWGKEEEEEEHMIAKIFSNKEQEAFYLNSFRLSPNPVKSRTEIKFNMKKSSYAEVRIYDFMGRIVAIPFKGKINANEEYTAHWNRQNLVSGTYICKLSTGNGQSFQRIAIAK